DLRVHLRAPPGRARRGLSVSVGEASGRASLVDGAGEARLGLPTRRRGWLHPGRITVSTTRPLGLARAWAYAWPATPLLVYPRPEASGPPLPAGEGDQAQAHRHPAGDDVHHLRAYRRGDPRRAIAWKPSARHGILMVREYEQPRGADVVLEWSALPLPHEARIARLARWVDEAEREGRRSLLRLPGQAIGPGRGAAHRHAYLRALALPPAAPGDARGASRAPHGPRPAIAGLDARRRGRVSAAAAAAAARRAGDRTRGGGGGRERSVLAPPPARGAARHAGARAGGGGPGAVGLRPGPRHRLRPA